MKETVKLYKHQEEAIEFLEKRNLKGYIALPPGLGKTLIVASLIKKYKPKRALILAPKSAHQVWKKELERLEVPPQSYVLYTYEKFLSEHKNKLNGNRGSVPYYTDFLVLDEAHRIKNIKAKTTRLLLNYGKYKIPKILLSGTPFKEIIDLYAQFFVIDPGILGKWKEFIDTYFVRETNPFGGVEYIPLDGAREKILEKISPYFFKRERDEIRELERIEVSYTFETPYQYSWEVFKTGVAKGIYEELKNEYGDDFDLEDFSEEEFLERFAEEIKGEFIKFYRLAEVNNKEKHLFIKEFVSDYPDTVIYTFFVEEALILSKMFDCYVITGKTPFKEREEIVKRQDKPIIITSALSEGANLDRYGTLIFSTIPSSPIRFAQVAGRIDRLSQKNTKITYIYLLDEYNARMLDLLKGRKTVYDLFSEILKSKKTTSSHSQES